MILSDKGLKRGDVVSAEYIYVHGTVGDLGEGILDERRTLGTGGFVSAIISLRIEGANATLVGNPEIVSRGWVSGDDGDQIHKDALRSVTDAVEDALSKGVRKRTEIEKIVRRTLGRFVSNRTRLRPSIVPVVLGAHE